MPRSVLVKSRLLFLMIGLCFSPGCETPGQFSPEKPIQKTPYIIVYGREDCPVCVTFKQKLTDAQIDYAYKDMENESVQNELYPRMERAGLNTQKFLLPVIDVNGSLAARPLLRDSLDRYGHPSPEDHSVATETSASACKESGANPSNCKQ